MAVPPVDSMGRIQEFFTGGANKRIWGTEFPVGSGAKPEFSLNFQDGAIRMSPRKCGGWLKTGGLCPPAAA